VAATPIADAWLTGEVLNGVKVEKYDWKYWLAAEKKQWKYDGEFPTEKDVDTWVTRVSKSYDNTIAVSDKATSKYVAHPPNKFVLHKTGGTRTGQGAHWEWHGIETLTRKGSWPHFLVGREHSLVKTAKLHIVQFLPIDGPSWSLVSGGDSAIEVETVAHPDQIFTDDAGVADTMKALIARVRKTFPSITNTVPWKFEFIGTTPCTKKVTPNTKYPCGSSLPTHKYDEWTKTSGIVGHMHAPGLIHNDPLEIDATKVLS